jgi:hypothetical protein
MEPAILFFALRLAGGALLVGILILLLYAQWREATWPHNQVSALPHAQLILLAGSKSGQAFRLAEVNLIGRAGDNDLQLDEPTVSAYHARLSYQQNQWWLEDLGSRNGTWVNELRVRQPMVITFGDRLKLGAVEMVFEPGHPKAHDLPAAGRLPAQERAAGQ